MFIRGEREMSKVQTVTHERLTELLDYDPATGVFAWKVRVSNRIKAGDRAGVVGTAGYRLITIDGVKMQATRIAIFYMTGEWPIGYVLPANGDRDDVRLSNLIDQSRVAGARERGATKNNTSGFRGVSKSAYPGRWQARLTWNGRQIGLGTKFETPEDASEIYEEASRRLLSAADESDLEVAVNELNLWRRQRAAWRGVERTHPGHGWTSFENFCETVKEVPEKRWAMVPVDILRPLVPDNFSCALPAD